MSPLQRWMGRVARVGCIACIVLGYGPTPAQVHHIREGRLGRKGAVRGSQMPIADVDAFVVFQRLREIDVLFDGSLSGRYLLSRVEGRVANGWLDCPDFLLERTR